MDVDGGASHLVGHSRGGLVAAWLAREHPDLARTVTPVDSSTAAPVPVEEGAKFYRALARKRPPGPPSLDSVRVEPVGNAWSSDHLTDAFLERPLPKDVRVRRSHVGVMTVIEGIHADHGATFAELGDRRVVADYGRPERTHRAVRNVVGVTEHVFGVLVVEGEDRVEFVDNAVSNRVPDGDGEGCYALLLDPSGEIRTEMYVFNAAAGDRLLVFLPPDEVDDIAADWRSKTFIQDVAITESTDDFGVFGVYGPQATEKIASVLTNASSPDRHLSFVRGSMGDVGVTVIRDDGLTGEEGYLVVCSADAADETFDTLENRGQAAAPFGHRTWGTLTLEAGTPLFETELRERLPNDLGIRTALDFEKGCYVGQEVVSRVENRGQPGQRLVGLVPDVVPASGAAVFADDAAVGEVTRAAESPSREEPVALALVDADAAARDSLTLRVDGEEVAGSVEPLPFVEGSDRSARLPAYPGDADH